jgi:hypothetical protein
MGKISRTWQDYVIRGAFIVAGVVAAVLFTMHGQAEALPPLALGGVLGACFIGMAEPDE